ncbi:hypothetical protein Celaphus_00016956 [Cervus elaphus hippelaphus]|uniref:Uncharacterized protein n=1 Tax=Cervus elaphus hippelaphus TaxID=46360 RepID=A0A212CN39_CEREH|nr:hypothetical protein Celaphus_00016956 [Cervus elaphus hippelaphus]
MQAYGNPLYKEEDSRHRLVQMASEPLRLTLQMELKKFPDCSERAHCKAKMKEQPLCKKIGNWNPVVTPKIGTEIQRMQLLDEHDSEDSSVPVNKAKASGLHDRHITFILVSQQTSEFTERILEARGAVGGRRPRAAHLARLCCRSTLSDPISQHERIPILTLKAFQKSDRVSTTITPEFPWNRALSPRRRPEGPQV